MASNRFPLLTTMVLTQAQCQSMATPITAKPVLHQ